MTTGRAKALADRRRVVKCGWCGKRFVSYHKAVKYCLGTQCANRAKAARHKAKGVR